MVPPSVPSERHSDQRPLSGSEAKNATPDRNGVNPYGSRTVPTWPVPCTVPSLCHNVRPPEPSSALKNRELSTAVSSSGSDQRVRSGETSSYRRWRLSSMLVTRSAARRRQRAASNFHLAAAK